MEICTSSKISLLPSGTLYSALDFIRFRHCTSIVASVVNPVRQRRTLSVINWRPSSVELCWQYLRWSTFDRCITPGYNNECAPLFTALWAWRSASRGSVYSKLDLFTGSNCTQSYYTTIVIYLHMHSVHTVGCGSCWCGRRDGRCICTNSQTRLRWFVCLFHFSKHLYDALYCWEISDIVSTIIFN